MTTTTLPEACACDTVAENDRIRAVKPPIDIYETKDAFVLRANTPGLNESDLNVRIEDSTLYLDGTATVKDMRGVFHRLYDKVRYERAFNLGEGVDQDNIQAELRQGTLTITLAKVAKAQSKQVTIRTKS